MTNWILQWHHDIIPVSRLPLPQELQRPPCMTGRRWRRVHRLLRQLAPRPEVFGCCDYHDMDWADASETAIRLLGAAHAEGLSGEAAGDRVVELARAEGVTGNELDAVECLVTPVDPIMLDDDGDINEGRHRIQAMIDQGVRRTVLLRLVLIDPATG